MKTKLHVFAAIAFVAIIFYGCKKEFYSPTNSKTKPGISNLTDAALASEDTTTVITPYGPRLKSEVVLIEPGYNLAYSSEGHIQKIETATGKMVKDFGFPRPSKKTIKNNATGKSNNTIIPSTVNPNFVEWALASQYKQGPNILAFSTQWTVPSLPTTLNDGQVIYIFNGLQSPDSTSLLQPVLQYGFDGTNGGNYWSVQNFFIPGCLNCSPVFHGANIQVSPGTVLIGSMTKSGTTGTYAYTSSFGTTYSSNNLSVTSYPYINLEYGIETLEAYHITAYTDYPPDSAVRMTSIVAGGGNPVITWGLNNAITNYGQHIKAVGNAEIDLYFHWPNQVQSQTYTKNNCGSGYNGSNVVYTVPAGKYEASTQSAANTLALNDIAANGQNYANTYGSCTLTGVAFSVSNTSSEGVTITFERVDGSIMNINGSSPAHSGTTTPCGNIPPGVYNIVASPSGFPNNCTITLNTGQSLNNVPGGIFSNITVGSTQTNSMTLR